MVENNETKGRIITTAKNTTARIYETVIPIAFLVILRYNNVGMTIPLKQNKNAEILEISKIIFGKQNVKNKHTINGTTETKYSISTCEHPHLKSLCTTPGVTTNYFNPDPEKTTDILENVLFHGHIVNRGKQRVEDEVHRHEDQVRVLDDGTEEVRLHEDDLRNIGISQVVVAIAPHSHPQNQLETQAQFQEFRQSL